MATVSTPNRGEMTTEEPKLGGSRYRDVLAKFGGPGTTDIRALSDTQRDDLYEYLKTRRLEDVTLCVAYWLLDAERREGLNQADVASEMGATRSLISQILSGRVISKPQTFERLARVLDFNPLELYLAAGWLDLSDIMAYQTPGQNDLRMLADKLQALPANERHKWTKLAEAILDTVVAEVQHQRKEPKK